MQFYSFRTIYIDNGTPHTLQWVLTYYQSFNRTCAVVILGTKINTATLKCTITQYLLIKLSSPRKKKKQRRRRRKKKNTEQKKKKICSQYSKASGKLTQDTQDYSRIL